MLFSGRTLFLCLHGKGQKILDIIFFSPTSFVLVQDLLSSP